MGFFSFLIKKNLGAIPNFSSFETIAVDTKPSFQYGNLIVVCMPPTSEFEPVEHFRDKVSYFAFVCVSLSARMLRKYFNSIEPINYILAHFDKSVVRF